MKNPQVSVCLPALNAEPYLLAAVESVQGQTLPNWELIIIDNASRDRTRELLHELLAANRDSRITVHRQARTLPMVENWNAVIRRARGQYVKLLCADDVLVPDCLERQVKALEDHPEAVLASGSRVIVNREGKHLFTRNGIGATGVYRGLDIIRRCILSGTNIIGDPVNVLWRQGAMERAGIFDEEVIYCADIEYWLRLLCDGDLFYDQIPVGHYRIHPSASANSLADVTVKEFLRVADKICMTGKLNLSETERHRVRFRSWYKNRIRKILYRILG